MFRSLLTRARGVESLAALAACIAASLLASRRLLRPDVLSDDALVHLYWMWNFRDPQLFDDSLTAELRESTRYPDGYELGFRLASQVFDPISFGEWVGVALMAISGWLVFRIVREHTDWRPAAWIAAALFLALVDIHRFHGGFPRAFVHPIVLLTVLESLRGQRLRAALVAAGGALLYPPAALLAVGVLVVSALRLTGRRLAIDRSRAAFAALALLLAAAAVLIPQLASGGAPRVFTADEARAFPEFGPRGALHFFEPSAVEYLRQNRSGFDLRATGSILALAALALLLVRRANVQLLKAEVLALPIVALAGYAAAQAVLFKLYLPHRYTYPLVAFFAIAIGVAIKPTWTALLARPRPRLRAFAMLAAPLAVAAVAVSLFPLGPARWPGHFSSGTALGAAAIFLVVAAAVAMSVRTGVAAAGAVVTGVTLLVLVLAAPDSLSRGSACPSHGAARYLATLPKDAVIAGDPIDLKCLPALTRRPVVISTQLAPAYEVEYFLAGRARMAATLRAYYGPSIDALAALHSRYGASHLWVRRAALRAEMEPGGRRWRAAKLPYGQLVRRLVEHQEPAALRLPLACREWSRGTNEVYDIACIAGRLRRQGQDTIGT